LAGEVKTVGKDVKRFKPGDRVYGTSDELGAYAEYTCWKGNSTLIKIPENITYVEAGHKKGNVGISL
jgi:NADPH2:quinone reductase